MRQGPFFSVIAACTALLFSAASFAQTAASPKLVISNAGPNQTGVEVPLLSTSSVTFSDQGDLTAVCDTTSTLCSELGTGTGSGSGTPPPVFTLSPTTATTVTQGTNNVTLSWNSSADLCRGETPAGIAAWTNQRFAATGTLPLSLNSLDATTAATYQFTIRCYNATGSRTATTGVITVNPVVGGGGTPAEGFCADYLNTYYGGTAPTDSRFTAHGLTRVDTTMQAVWNAEPGDGGPSIPVTGTFLNPALGKYLAIEFAMTQSTGALSQFILDWVENQGQGGVPAASSISITVSPCPGDFRVNVSGSPDPWLSSQCRRGGATNTLTVSSDSALSGCSAPINKKMYINVAPSNMFGPAAPTTTNCGASAFCGVSMKIR